MKDKYKSEELVDRTISHGTFTEYKKGKLYSITKINRGKKDSLWTYFHSNGNIEHVESYDNGVLSGFKRFYSKKGVLYYEVFYSSNEIVYDTIYNKLEYNYKFNLYKHGKYYYRKYKTTQPDTLDISNYRRDAIKKYLEVENFNSFLKKARYRKKIRIKGYKV
jgi:hypothetical protein